jgi:hypothetical protein
MTIIEAIDRELIRLHNELQDFEYRGISQEHNPGYHAVLNEINQLNQLLAAVAKKEAKIQE